MIIFVLAEKFFYMCFDLFFIWDNLYIVPNFQ